MRRPLKDREKHPVTPDHRYDSEQVARFINHIMEGGKKSGAERIVYNALDIVKEKTKQDPREVFETALENVGPSLEVRSRRVGGANYQVPYEVRPERKMALAMRWMKSAAGKGKGRPMEERLADEITAAAQNEGEAIKKREAMHSMAEANKAFAHFAFVGSRKKK